MCPVVSGPTQSNSCIGRWGVGGRGRREIFTSSCGTASKTFLSSGPFVKGSFCFSADPWALLWSEELQKCWFISWQNMYWLLRIRLPAVCIYTFSSHQPCRLGIIYAHLTNEKTQAPRGYKSGITQLLSHKPRFWTLILPSKVLAVPAVSYTLTWMAEASEWALLSSLQPLARLWAPSEPHGFRWKARVPGGYICQQHLEIFFVIRMATNL